MTESEGFINKGEGREKMSIITSVINWTKIEDGPPKKPDRYLVLLDLDAPGMDPYMDFLDYGTPSPIDLDEGDEGEPRFYEYNDDFMPVCGHKVLAWAPMPELPEVFR